MFSRITFVITIFNALALVKAGADTDHCYALALSGGGTNAVWESGVFWGLTHYGNPDDFKYDVVTGISGGSINTGMISLFAIGDEVNASEKIAEIYKSLKQSDLIREWDGGLVEGLFFQAGIMDNTPGYEFGQQIYQHYTETKRRYVITANDANTGAYTKFTDQNIPFTDLVDAIIASSSVPFVFPPHHYNGTYFIDGGSTWNINLDSAIQRCLEIVDDPSKITLDVMICGDENLNTTATIDNSAYGNFLRNKDIHDYFVNYDSIYQEMEASPTVNYRYLFEEHDKASGEAELNFNGD